MEAEVVVWCVNEGETEDVFARSAKAAEVDGDVVADTPSGGHVERVFILCFVCLVVVLLGPLMMIYWTAYVMVLVIGWVFALLR